MSSLIFILVSDPVREYYVQKWTVRAGASFIVCALNGSGSGSGSSGVALYNSSLIDLSKEVKYGGVIPQCYDGFMSQ